MNKLISTLLLASILVSVSAKDKKPEYYSLIVYRIKNTSQAEKVDQYLKQAYLPALHRLGKKTLAFLNR